ncbi:MAG: hypothetical protein MI867_12420 [Pseudomonadales bacterium]|nr:hypothetical protein [Pseudomonadales bacterium]
MTVILNRDQILKADDLKTEVVDVPEWGGQVRVRSLTAGERDTFEASITDNKKSKSGVVTVNIRARIASMCIVDEENKRIFTEQDIAALGEKSGIALNRVFVAAQNLNGWTEEDVEELEKN